MKLRHFFLSGIFLVQCFSISAQPDMKIHEAKAPLYRDPIFDGAADPVMVWNQEEKSWWMLYTQRRANVETPGVSYCYGNDIGIASSKDNGQSWAYRGALDLNIEKGKNTFWAPDIVYDKGTYHMFVVYIQGTYTNWGGDAKLAHYTSKNLWDWKFLNYLKTPKSNIIDATLMQMPDKKWHIWYKGEGSVTMTGESTDLLNWTFKDQPAIGKPEHEGPKAFIFAGHYWMLTDEWHGMRVHPERKTHGDAPEDSRGNIPYGLRRSSIQVAELIYKDGTLTCDRDQPFDFWLPNFKN